MKISSLNTHNKIYSKPITEKTQEIIVNQDLPQIEASVVAPLGYYSSNISFGKIKNSEPLRKIFAYAIPDLYSEIITIDPKRIAKLMKTDAFEVPLKKFMQVFKPFEESLFKDTNETKLYRIIKANSEKYPDMSVSELVQKIAPGHEKKLRRIQAPIFSEIDELAKSLPEEQRYAYKLLRAETQNKLDGKPIKARFSTKDFKYKLEKIRDYVAQRKDPEADKVMERLIKEADKLPPSASYNAIAQQKSIIDNIELLFKSSTLSKNEQLNDLINASRGRLNNESIIVPFSRKNFLYDLDKLTENIPDKALREKMLSVAETLPKSSDSLSAFIVKIKDESSEKIAYRILDPSMASVEHLHPASCGGPDAMSNFACASRRENTERGNIPFVEQLKRRPLTPEYAQRQMDRYIELANQGVFAKNNVDLTFIQDFKDKIYEESGHKIILDTSKLNIAS